MARPLTKRDSTGNLYVRSPQVEAQIDEILSQSPATLQHRLAVRDSQASDYLSYECLVHLARVLRYDNEAMANAVLSALISRCEAILLSKIPDNKLATAADVREEVIGQFGELFATDGTEDNRDDLDYFECRFNQAFSTFCIDLVRSEIARLKRFESLPDQADDTEPSPHKEIPARLIEALQSQETAESAVLLSEIYAAIDALPDDERKAVTLYHVMGYKIESKDPDEVTAATICKVSGRTIRNRLSRAAEKLSHLKEI